MELTTTINSSFSRTRGNELNKGYYPTFPTDIQTVLRILEPSFGLEKPALQCPENHLRP